MKNDFSFVLIRFLTSSLIILLSLFYLFLGVEGGVRNRIDCRIVFATEDFVDEIVNAGGIEGGEKDLIAKEITSNNV